MKKYIFILFMAISFLWSCVDDKGNYDYRDMGEITIGNVPELIEVLTGNDRIIVNPEISSSLYGELKDGDRNFEYTYLFDKVSGSLNEPGEKPWIVLNTNGSMNLDTVANFPAGDYVCSLVVKDLSTDLEARKNFRVKVTSSIYEGWMVLCNEGEKNRVRLDMISRISGDKTVTVHDVLAGNDMPEEYNATQIGFAPSLFWGKEAIYIFSETNSYKIGADNFYADESWNIKNVDFIIPPEVSPVCYAALNSGFMVDNTVRICVMGDGDVYAITSNLSGSAFEFPINTSSRGGDPEFKVAPAIGYSMARPGNALQALMYDTDNKRFVGWASSDNADAQQTMAPLPDPETNKKFSYRTGKEFVHMEGTRFSNGIVYTILQDEGGKRSVYGINAGGNSFVQESYYETINAPEFNQASEFAFHSQYPFMFFAVKDKVYLYDLGTGTNYPLAGIKLGAEEEVTLLKFNLYQQPSYDFLPDDEEFIAQQYHLIVGSYDKGAAGVNGGKVAFYRIDRSSHSASLLDEYKGFAKVQDVVYRERRR